MTGYRKYNPSYCDENLALVGYRIDRVKRFSVNINIRLIHIITVRQISVPAGLYMKMYLNIFQLIHLKKFFFKHKINLNIILYSISI